MRRLNINFKEIQKAMEDVSRDAFEYFFDIETGEVIILSEDIIDRAIIILNETYDDDMPDYDEVEFDGDYDIPDWMEAEIELALDIFLYKQDRYVRIPERDRSLGYAAMREFIDTLDTGDLKEELLGIIDGAGSFRRFKDALASYPKERRNWYGFNTQSIRKDIIEWLKTIGIEQKPE